MTSYDLYGGYRSASALDLVPYACESPRIPRFIMDVEKQLTDPQQ